MIIRGNSNSIPLADNSVDAVVTDPPYGLSFMGKDWDRAVPTVDLWREVLRVMKPGAFAAVLCTPRQDCQARMIMNLEAAGFMTGFTSIMWTYATGFPKAANLSKLADKRAGAVREIVAMASRPDGTQRPNKANWTPGANTYAQDQWTQENMATGGNTITAPATPEARALDGAYAGFQPKPAFEPVLIVMKPLSEKTYLDQALTNGKGCSWLDGGRIPTGKADIEAQRGRSGGGYGTNQCAHGGREIGKTFDPPAGRFPANVICCDDVLNDGRVRTSGAGNKANVRPTNSTQVIPTVDGGNWTADSGSYSRYFDLDRWFADRIASLPEEVRRVFPWLIVPKPSKREKNAGLTRPPVTVGDGRKKSIDNAFQRGQTERVNSHVSVKPVKLMLYLITLFSQPGDVVLDPFAGSGTTGVSAEILNRRFIGIELDPEYAQIAVSREQWAAMEGHNETQTTNTEKAKPKDNSPGTESTLERTTSNTGSRQQSLEWE